MTVENSLLGQETDYPLRYAPELLFPIPRAEGRRAVGLTDENSLPFQGVDVWTHYEVSWLDAGGKPRIAVAELRVPANSPCIIESKSLKLYFNSLNFERFESESVFLQRVVEDLSRVAGAAVAVSLLSARAASVQITELPGLCLDELPLHCERFVLDASTLHASGVVTEETLCSHLLRSNCPVTNQPDWGSVFIHYRGPLIDHAGLLAYLISYRQHADFHEQCVERIFMDIWRRCQPQSLTVYARYTRRGGLDINPFRSSGPKEPESWRLFRQ